MTEACLALQPALDVDAMRLDALEAVAREAWVLDPPRPDELRAIDRDRAGFLVDELLTMVARSTGALEVALGDGLAALADGDGALRLGFSCIGDYARERLDLGARTAQGLARLARALRSRPHLREAVRRGEVSARKAETVLELATGEAEAAWVARARTETVRALAAAARAVGPPEEEEDEPWRRVLLDLSADQRALVDHALELAGQELGPTAPRWERVEAICQEYLGAHPGAVVPPDPEQPGVVHGAADDGLEGAKEALEKEFDCWRWLNAVAAREAPPSPAEVDGARSDRPFRIDEELRRIAAMRARWGELLGHLAMLLRTIGLWRDMRFATFGHYCAERLGLSARTVEQRIWLERRMYVLPSLRQALRSGRLSYEQARILARCADEATLLSWLPRAEGMTCVELRRAFDDDAAPAQTCAPRHLDLPMPSHAVELLQAAIQTARHLAGHWLSPGEAFTAVAQHFVDTYPPRKARKALARDHHRCKVPCCSRAALHVHHVLFRSRGGGDELANLISVCAAHHLHAIHRGWVRVSGRAPDGLTWELGVRPGRPPACGTWGPRDRRTARS